MFKYYSSYALIFSTLTHFLCCGIPLILTFSSLFTGLLFFESLALSLEFLEPLEIYLFAITTTLFLFIIIFEIYKKKIKNITDEENCKIESCDATNKKIKLNLMVSATIYVFNASFFVSEVLI